MTDAHGTGSRSRWHPRDGNRADAMGLSLVVLGIALHGSLLVVLGPAPGGLWFQGAVLAAQVVGLVALARLRARLPAAFWAVLAVAVTPLTATISPFYPGATLVVLPTAFLLVLFASSTLSRPVARAVAAESLVVAGFVICRDPAGHDLTVVELLFVLGTLATTHLVLVRSVEAQAALVSELERAVRVDSLTGLLARRAVEELVHAELAGGRLTSLVLLDVDGFKAVNDTYGHPTGDAALQHVANALVAGSRAGDDVAGRLGGDEFAVVLRGCDPDVAYRRARELVATIAGSPLGLPGGESVALGVSVGVATARGGTVEELYAAADAALYAAKAGGRGRAVAAAA